MIYSYQQRLYPEPKGSLDRASLLGGLYSSMPKKKGKRNDFLGHLVRMLEPNGSVPNYKFALFVGEALATLEYKTHDDICLVMEKINATCSLLTDLIEEEDPTLGIFFNVEQLLIALHVDLLESVRLHLAKVYGQPKPGNKPPVSNPCNYHHVPHIDIFESRSKWTRVIKQIQDRIEPLDIADDD